MGHLGLRTEDGDATCFGHWRTESLGDGDGDGQVIQVDFLLVSAPLVDNHSIFSNDRTSTLCLESTRGKESAFKRTEP